MTQSRVFCPRCGDPVPDREDPLPGEPRDRDASLCDDCYFEDFALVDAPERIEVAVCGRCGAIQRGKEWRDIGARDYTDVAIDEVTEALGVHVNATEVNWAVEPEQVDETTVRIHAEFSGIVRETLREEQITVSVRIARGTCDRCGRIAGGYYSGIVQVRAADRQLEAAERRRAVEIAESHVAAQEQGGDREAFITEITETDEGPDIKVSTNALGKAVATRIIEEFGGNVKSHPTLVTEDEDGNEVYRVTFAVRLPEFRAGDIIDPEDGDGPVLVTGTTGGPRGVRLASGEICDGIHNARKLATRDDSVKTTVVTVEDAHAVQVLDPETYESVTIPRPEYFDDSAETTEVLKSQAGLYILPADS